ncbi:tyrosine-type recombinase/integrase [Lentzea sp. E54]|uniref:tyrosine-type recombinase/integrase n=1 Tax=Lentzea xerophila TaxID=3435883 RepID=UPI003DA1CD0E
MSRTTLSDHWSTYRTQRSRKVATNTLASETSSCLRFVRAWDGSRRSPKSMDGTWVEDYLFGEDGIAAQMQPDSYNKTVTHLRGFVTWLLRRGIVSGDVLDALETLKAGPTKQYPRLTLEQMEEIVGNAADPWERFVVALGFQTLGRWSELQAVRWAHVNLAASRITWWREKTDEADALPITAKLDHELRAWILYYEASIGRPLEPDDFMVPRRKWIINAGWRLLPKLHSNKAILTTVKSYAGPYLGGADAIKGQGVHILRRSAARELYEALKRQGEPDPIRIVMAMLGHKNVKTTERYIGIERDRETRDALLSGSALLSIDRSNMVDLTDWKLNRHGA